jgi:hypothetical protein
MSIVSKFAYTNNTPSTFEVAPVSIDLAGDYSNKTLEKNKKVQETWFNNLSTPNSQMETIIIHCNKIDTVDTDLTVFNPSKYRGGIQFRVTAEEILRTTNTEDLNWAVDDPIVTSIQVRCPYSDYVTDEHIAESILRALGAMRDPVTGEWQILKIMKGDTNPTN